MHLIPHPAHIKLHPGHVQIPDALPVCSSGTELPFPFFLTELKERCGLQAFHCEGNGQLQFTRESGHATEGYRLSITEDGIEIAAATDAGLFYGSRSLLQLLMEHSLTLPCLQIEDQPAYSWRGLLIDSSRHMQSVEELKRLIDLAALHKLNTLQWHLTDDQGWRLELQKYPKLTEIGSRREQTLYGHLSLSTEQFDGRPYGGFYTQDEIRDLVQYAEDRYVTIVPELDLPGHFQAAIAAYPELGCTGEQINVAESWGVKPYLFNPSGENLVILKEIFDEVLDLFPSTYIHIGGDEAMKDQWKESPFIQARIRELGVGNEEGLQAWLLKEIETHLSEAGRCMIGWDEILDGPIRTSTAVTSWRGEERGILGAQRGHKVVMANHQRNYFDYYQIDPAKEPLAIGGLTTCKDTYEYRVCPEGLGEEAADRIMGLQGQIWTEYIDTYAKLEYMTFPRLCALSENAWLPDERKSWTRFSEAWSVHRKRLDGYGVNYFHGPLER